jgi:hypothetical protein
VERQTDRNSREAEYFPFLHRERSGEPVKEAPHSGRIGTDVADAEKVPIGRDRNEGQQKGEAANPAKIEPLPTSRCNLVLTQSSTVLPVSIAVPDEWL